MQDELMQKTMGQRIKSLRKEIGWTQRELATRIDSSFAQLNKYEGGQNTPPLDKLALIAASLKTTIDYLVTGDTRLFTAGSTDRLMQRLNLIQDFSLDEKDVVITVIDAMIARHTIERNSRSMADQGARQAGLSLTL